jgi:capsular exopolysaccharide synthesis family protein
MVKDLEFAEESLRLQEARLDEQWRNRPETPDPILPAIAGAGIIGPVGGPVSIEAQLSLAREEFKLAQAEYQRQKQDFTELFDTAETLEDQTAILQHKRGLFEAVRQEKDAKDMEKNVPGSISILTNAMAPSEPASDRRVVFTAMALFMGLGMGGGVAFLRASKNQTIYAPQDMPPTMHAPFLGYIPITRVRGSFNKSLHEEVQRNRHNKIESVRLVRTALLSRLNGRGGATILVTSATEGTGKSTFTMMLGESLAQAGKKVLMIDADLRRMTLSKRFGICEEPGFMESMRYRSVDKRQIFPTDTPRLSIMSAGNPNENGAVFEETANGAFKACISQLRKLYDIVLLDSSPMLPVADATILSSQVDGTIMVERELVSHRGNVVDALARLDSAGGRLMGTVFVGSSPSRNYGDYYGYGYGRSKTRYQ